MAIDWDNIEIIAEDENIVRLTDWNAVEIISEDEDVIKLSDSNIINVDAEDRMIIFGGERGADGPQGPEGPRGQAGSVRVGTTTTLPAGSDATVTNRGTSTDAVFDFGIPKGVDGDNAPTWGNITGTLSDQSDLQNALSAKANTADLGDMATIDDAPSDNKEYARKNGVWSEVTGGGGGASEWGEIGGTLSDQTDLQNALDAKANTADLGDLAGKDSVDYLTEVTNKPTLGTLAGKNSVDYSTNEITNKPTLGALAAKSSVDYSTSEVTNKPTLGTMAAVNDASGDSKLYGRKNGAWSEVPTPSAPEWGDIGGTLSDQTDLANALAAKADSADLGDLAGMDSIDYTSAYLTNKPMLGALASQDTVDWDTDITDIPAAFPPDAHTHDAGDITSGTLAIARGGTNASDAENARINLGAVNKAGDTMTGNLIISKTTEAQSDVKNTSVTAGTAPSANTWVGSYNFRDSNNFSMGYTAVQYTTGKSSMLRLTPIAKTANNTSVYNTLDLYANADGTKNVSFGNPEAWRKSLFPSNLASSGQYFLSITNDWASGGYIPNNVVCDSIGATKTSVFPNDHGLIKTKCRCESRSYSGSGNPIWYFKVATFPATSNVNFCSLIFRGRYGGWSASHMGYIEGMAWNRDGAGFASFSLVKSTDPANIFNNFVDLAIYKNTSNNEEYVYILARNYYAFDFDFYLYQDNASLTYDSTYVTSLPSNYTRTALLSTSTPRVVVTPSKFYVNGTALN